MKSILDKFFSAEEDKALAKEPMMVQETIDQAQNALRDFEATARGLLTEIRALRMASMSELHQATQSYADVRKFFLSESHELEVVRLREFVDLCERLQTLKNAGFLDQVADIMLKMEKL